MSSSLVIRIDAGHSPSRTFQISDPIVLRRVIFLIDNLGLSPEYGDFTIDQALDCPPCGSQGSVARRKKVGGKQGQDGIRVATPGR